MHFKTISTGETEDKDSTFKDENIFGEKEKRNRLTVIDDVSALAERSNNLGSFWKLQESLNTAAYIFFTNIINPEIFVADKKL